MEVFRIASAKHATQLSASGRSARWNLDDEFVLYTGSSRALASLELVVHRNSIKPVLNYKMMVIAVADDQTLITEVLPYDLPENWRSTGAYPELQQIGSDWYSSMKSLLLKVPSAIIPKEYNYLINTKHPDFDNKVSLVTTEDHFWDERLL